jgi:hypothetical protein
VSANSQTAHAPSYIDVLISIDGSIAFRVCFLFSLHFPGVHGKKLFRQVKSLESEKGDAQNALDAAIKARDIAKKASDTSKKDLEASLVAERAKGREMEKQLSQLQDRLKKAEGDGGSGRVRLGSKLPLPVPSADADGPEAKLREEASALRQSLREAQDRLKKAGRFDSGLAAVVRDLEMP